MLKNSAAMKGVAQRADQWLSTPDVYGSNPVVGNTCWKFIYFWKEKTKKGPEAVNSPFIKTWDHVPYVLNLFGGATRGANEW